MRRVLAVTSGRADASPMAPIVAALTEGPCRTGAVSLESIPLAECINEILCCELDEYDIVLLLGDRYEILAAALAATVARVPIAHIHGGEASFGSFDNQIRDAITKLSHIHFVAHAQAAIRLDELSEEYDSIHIVGAPGLDNVVPIMAEGRTLRKIFVVTYHPATLGDDRGAAAMVEALKQFPDYLVMWTGANDDPGAEQLRGLFKMHGVPRCSYTADEYLRAVRDCAAVIGNSSSGIIEAPSLGVPTVNIGPRQDGRLKGPSVIDRAENVEAIIGGIAQALTYKGPFDNPYGGPGASAKIADILATIDLDGILVKRWNM